MSRAPRYVLPEDAKFMREALAVACDALVRPSPADRDDVAHAIHWNAQSGYARNSDGTINVAALAQAALLHFWRMRGKTATGEIAA